MGVESAPNLPRIKLDAIFTNLLPMLVFESLLYMVANSCTNAYSVFNLAVTPAPFLAIVADTSA